jgi:hypothetical protein
MLPLRQLRGPASRSLLSRSHIPISRSAIQRSMATSTGKKIEWLIILPDREGALSRRMEVRPYVSHIHLPTSCLYSSSHADHSKLTTPFWNIGPTLRTSKQMRMLVSGSSEVLISQMYPKRGRHRQSLGPACWRTRRRRRRFWRS